MKPTRREWHVIGIAAILTVISACFDQHTLKAWEVAFLILIVLPLGIYIITDPENKKAPEGARS